MATRGRYVQNSMGIFFFFFGGGHPENVCLLQFYQNIYGFRQNDSQIL